MKLDVDNFAHRYFSSKLFLTHLLLEICRLRMFLMARGVGFWIPPVIISLNIFFKKLIRRINFLKNMFKEIVTGGTQKPTPRAIKNMRNRQMSRSRCVLKKSLLEKSICEQSYQHPTSHKKGPFLTLIQEIW